jgi:uncharacterized protein involved in exopolysaccharide biosynthesis
MSDEINLRDYMDVIKRRWKLIFFIVVIVTTGAFVFSKMQQPIYETKTTILVDTGEQRGSSRFAGLAGIMGIQLSGGGGASSHDLSQFLKSKALALKVLKDLKLRERIKGWDDPKIKDHSLASSIQGSLKKPKVSGKLMEISVEHSDPELTVEITNGFIQALSYYLNKLNYTEARSKREYIEKQMPRVHGELRSIERKIKSFSLLGVTRPSIEYKRLQREYEIQNSVYVMLRKEYESVKLEESKEIPPFTVLDKAYVPRSPIRPRVKLNTLIGLFLGLFSGVFMAFFFEYLGSLGRHS